MRLPRLGLVVLCASLVTGCPDKQPVGPADAGGPVAEDPQDASTTPPPVAFTLRYQLADAGMERIPLTIEERPTIESTSELELRTFPGLRNYRVRLFDEIDRAMVSDDSVEESNEGVIYRIALPTPLKPGHKYTLVVDAQTGTAFTDTLGREVADLRFEFQIAGEKEKPAPPKPGKKNRR